MIEFGLLSHVGLRREHNEDTFYGDSELGLWLVADGMGGHEFGEVASAMARDIIVREVRGGTHLIDAIRRADSEIIEHSKRRNDALPMGTTVASARINQNRFEVAWVGDSRAYLWNGELQQLSHDHSYVQELIEQGAITAEQARSHPHRNVVTQALGVTDLHARFTAQQCQERREQLALFGGIARQHRHLVVAAGGDGGHGVSR